MVYLVLLVLISNLFFLIIVYKVYLSSSRRKKEYWNKINQLININNYNNFEFIGGPCDGEWKFLPSEKTIFIYKKYHQYKINEVIEGNKTRKVFKYINEQPGPLFQGPGC